MARHKKEETTELEEFPPVRCGGVLGLPVQKRRSSKKFPPSRTPLQRLVVLGGLIARRLRRVPVAPKVAPFAASQPGGEVAGLKPLLDQIRATQENDQLAYSEMADRLTNLLDGLANRVSSIVVDLDALKTQAKPLSQPLAGPLVQGAGQPVGQTVPGVAGQPGISQAAGQPGNGQPATHAGLPGNCPAEFSQQPAPRADQAGQAVQPPSMMPGKPSSQAAATAGLPGRSGGAEVDPEKAEKWVRENTAKWLNDRCPYEKALGRTWRAMAMNIGGKIDINGKISSPRQYLHAVANWQACESTWTRIKARVALEVIAEPGQAAQPSHYSHPAEMGGRG